MCGSKSRSAALAVRDHVLERWLASTRTNYISQGKRVYCKRQPDDTLRLTGDSGETGATE